MDRGPTLARYLGMAILNLVYLGCSSRGVPFGELSRRQLLSRDEVAIAEALLRIQDEEVGADVRGLLGRLAADKSFDPLTRAMATMTGIKSPDQALALALNPNEGAIVRAAATTALLKMKPEARHQVRQHVEDRELPWEGTSSRCASF
jgi:hypothetical protein